MPIHYLKQIQLGEFNEKDYRISPSKGFESVVEGFYVFSRDPEKNECLIFNDGFPVVVFMQNEEDGISVRTEKERFEIKSAWASAGSIKNIYLKYNNDTRQVFIVRFYPAAFYQLFGLDAQYFRYRPIVPFDDIAGANDFNMKEFFGLSIIEQRSTFIERHIQNSLTKIDTSEILNSTLDYIHKRKGKLSVRHLSNEVGVNYKWLERSFAKNIGLSPKEYIQLQRFINAYHGLVDHRNMDLLDTAISSGYYDYNHFLKDFKSYTGKTPLTYLKHQSRI